MKLIFGSDAIHGGLKFDPLSPPSRDGICMPKQVWSTFFLFKIFDLMINSLQIRRFGPYSNSSNMQVWSIFSVRTGPNLFRHAKNHLISPNLYYESSLWRSMKSKPLFQIICIAQDEFRKRWIPGKILWGFFCILNELSDSVCSGPLMEIRFFNVNRSKKYLNTEKSTKNPRNSAYQWYFSINVQKDMKL